MSSRTRGKHSGRPQRQATASAIRLDLLVFVEGGTEVGYLTDWWRSHRSTVNLKIEDGHGTPMTLVERAVEQARLDRRAAKRGHGRAYDQIWCVFDRDEHPFVPEALNLAAQHGIHVALSTPCIELWFVLHFQDQTAHLERKEAQGLAKGLLGCGKNLTQEALKQLQLHYEEAQQRAVALDAKHLGDGSPAGSNPSSGLWGLIDEIRNAQPGT